MPVLTDRHFRVMTKTALKEVDEFGFYIYIVMRDGPRLSRRQELKWATYFPFDLYTHYYTETIRPPNDTSADYILFCKKPLILWKNFIETNTDILKYFQEGGHLDDPEVDKPLYFKMINEATEKLRVSLENHFNVKIKPAQPIEARISTKH